MDGGIVVTTFSSNGVFNGVEWKHSGVGDAGLESDRRMRYSFLLSLSLSAYMVNQRVVHALSVSLPH